MRENSITVCVNAELHVPKSTAECCLKLVEMYVNQTGCIILSTESVTGEKNYQFVEMESQNENDQN